MFTSSQRTVQTLRSNRRILADEGNSAFSPHGAAESLRLPTSILFGSTLLFVLSWAFTPAGGLPMSAPLMRGPRIAPRGFQMHFVNRPGSDAKPGGAAQKIYGFGADHDIALTFDDGPHPRHTDRVLDILAAYKVKATFFVNGYWLDPQKPGSRRARAALVRAHREGHTIGNHTYSHAALIEMDRAAQRWEIIGNEALIETLTGTPPTLFRAPYGQLTGYVSNLLSQRGYIIAGWNVAASQTSKGNADAIAEEILRWIRIRAGGVILLHDRDLATPPALTKILSKLAPRTQYPGHDKQRYRVLSLEAFAQPRKLAQKSAAHHLGS